MRYSCLIASFATITALASCTSSDSKAGTDTGLAAGSSTNSGTTTAAGAPGTPADPDRSTGGAGLPAGFAGRTDNPAAPITGAKYTPSGSAWEVVTGPAHIVYRNEDIASGSYTASATIDQLAKPAHPESFGIFFGGKDLDQPTQTYTYFLVRGTGELAVKVREGAKTRDVLKWTPSADVPKQDASGKAAYALAAKVTGDAILLMVNGKQVASVSKVGLPTDGVAGVRVNHNLHVSITPVSIITP